MCLTNKPVTASVSITKVIHAARNNISSHIVSPLLEAMV
jgi:hypothetical protein